MIYFGRNNPSLFLKYRKKIKKVIKEDLGEDIVSYEQEYEMVKKDRKEFKVQKRINDEKEEKIRELKIKKENLKMEKETKEEKMIEIKLEMKSFEEKKKENEERIKEIMNIKNIIKKERSF